MSGSRLPHARPPLAAAAAGLLLVALVGCGGDEAGIATASSETGEAHAMADLDMEQLDEPGATPADEVDGDVTSGEFELLDTAPPGSEGVRGTAWLAQDDAGTTVTIEFAGLQPGRDYVSHLHQQECAEDAGGDHFAFDPDGGDQPPNEVHLGFTAGEDGTGTATVTNDAAVGDGAPAIVVHPADAMDNRMACADFS